MVVVRGGSGDDTDGDGDDDCLRPTHSTTTSLHSDDAPVTTESKWDKSGAEWE